MSFLHVFRKPSFYCVNFGRILLLLINSARHTNFSFYIICHSFAIVSLFPPLAKRNNVTLSRLKFGKDEVLLNERKKNKGKKMRGNYETFESGAII